MHLSSSYLRPDESSNCQHLTIAPDQWTTDDDSTAEISIFDAHKYFNELSDIDNPKVMISSTSRVSPLVNLNGEHSSDRCGISSVPRRHSSASSSVDGSCGSIRNYRTRSFHAATPTASSEASWNSQTGLLSHPPGTIAVSIRNPPHLHGHKKKSSVSMSTPRWLFRRCPCSGKKSIQVDGNTKTSEPKISTPQRQTTPRLSQNQYARVSVNPNNTNPKTSVEKFPLNNLETVPNKPKSNNIFIKPNNCVDQRQSEQQQIIVTNCHKLSPAETPFPATLQSQRVLTSGRPFIDHAAGFTFPILKPSLTTSSSSSPSMKLQVHNGIDEDPPGDSLEVIRPPDIEPNSVSRKVLIDTDRQNFTYPASPKSRIIDDDLASDASSDLFEIESFSTQTTPTFPIAYRRRDSLDEASNFDDRRLSTNSGFLYGRRSLDEPMTPTITEGYEPSEASIDWSVTTAEGFDRASVNNFSVTASEIAGEITMIRGLNGNGCNRQPEKSRWKSSSGNGLLSCRCEKAVNVGPQPVKFVPVAKEHRGATPLPSRHVSSRPVTANKPSIA
ncbi:protein PHYTOCHROME KINASE SUBSTRATE 4 [Quillaja saponaria]|uniref:Protein PHYTOCHROME KINASE SUBSTRATE 4 n=1 Tax=Quillaja saponaria TaxID=32244 RepID=A0AAD7VDY1_QUISA|nr:protein PHYTOCHROME KINASE SUBSTRATE 4 [Quillaja saponaria]